VKIAYLQFGVVANLVYFVFIWFFVLFCELWIIQNNTFGLFVRVAVVVARLSAFEVGATQHTKQQKQQ